MKRRILIGLLASAALAACASGPSAGGGQAELIPLWTNFADHPKGYLGAAAPDSLAIIPPPPEASSPRGQADMAVYRATRALQGSPRWSQAAADADLETPNAPGKVFDCSLGTRITIEAQPVLMRLLARAMSDVDVAVKAPKEHYRRPRPFLSDNGQICVAKEDWLVGQASYPSGHAGTGMAWALILSELAPARTPALIKRGLEFGDSRVVCGVHYLSDVEAGRAAGAAVAARLKSDPRFAADFAVARAELDRAMSSGPRPSAGQCAAETAALATRPF